MGRTGSLTHQLQHLPLYWKKISWEQVSCAETCHWHTCLSPNNCNTLLFKLWLCYTRRVSSWVQFKSAVGWTLYKQERPPVSLREGGFRVWSGLRCKPLDDSPVIFHDHLIALLQLLVLRLNVHLTHVGHQLLWPQTLLHLCQLPLVLLQSIRTKKRHRWGHSKTLITSFFLHL